MKTHTQRNNKKNLSCGLKCNNHYYSKKKKKLPGLLGLLSHSHWYILYFLTNHSHQFPAYQTTKAPSEEAHSFLLVLINH